MGSDHVVYLIFVCHQTELALFGMWGYGVRCMDNHKEFGSLY
jgi:hypothetical protein